MGCSVQNGLLRIALVLCVGALLFAARPTPAHAASANPDGAGGIAQNAPTMPHHMGTAVPILMYHYVRVNPVARDKEGADLSVTPQHFAQQMNLLYSSGFHTITLDDLTGAILWGENLPPNPVILTFDDGYEDLYTVAYPILEQYGFKATSFVITGRVGKGGYLTWDEMRGMEASGLVQFESHTVSHVEMTAVPLARAQRELANSKATLEKQLGMTVRYFCYPSGRYDPSV